MCQVNQKRNLVKFKSVQTSLKIIQQAPIGRHICQFTHFTRHDGQNEIRSSWTWIEHCSNYSFINFEIIFSNYPQCTRKVNNRVIRSSLSNIVQYRDTPRLEEVITGHYLPQFTRKWLVQVGVILNNAVFLAIINYYLFEFT